MTGQGGAAWGYRLAQGMPGQDPLSSGRPDHPPPLPASARRNGRRMRLSNGLQTPVHDLAWKATG